MIRCVQCGKPNNPERENCENCGRYLLKGEEYSKKIQELQDYDNYRKRYSIFVIIISVLLLLFMLPVVKYVVRLIFTDCFATGIPQYLIDTLAPLIIFLTFVLAVFPVIIKRWKIYWKYRWTRTKRKSMANEINELPTDFLINPYEEKNMQNESDKVIKGPPAALLIIVFILVGLVAINEYSEVKPLDYIFSQFNISIGEAQIVSGQYECHYEQKDMGGGVTRADQTWVYVFYANGKYTTYLNGYQQYSGSWSQSGTTLTIVIPTIPGINNKPYSTTAKVARDASYFIVGGSGDKYVRIDTK